MGAEISAVCSAKISALRSFEAISFQGKCRTIRIVGAPTSQPGFGVTSTLVVGTELRASGAEVSVLLGQKLTTDATPHLFGLAGSRVDNTSGSEMHLCAH